LIIKRVLNPNLSGSLRAGLAAGLLLLCITCSAQALARGILVLGDSISAAYGMSLEQGWVNLLAEQLADAEPAAAVVNASISGETTAGGLRRLPQLLAQHKPDVVIIELGANDGLRGFPLAGLRANLDKLVSLAQGAGARVILVPMEIPPNYGARYTAGFRETFIEVARDTDSILAPFLLDGVATDPALMQADGLHPRPEAQARLLQNMLPTIQAALAQ
jgi:acyl-CoA thioesterase-1